MTDATPPDSMEARQEEARHLQEAITALEAQRPVLGDQVVDTALAPLRERLEKLQTQLPQEQRKYVTVLFADLVESTALAVSLDPEDLRALMRAYFESWRNCVLERGGEVEKFIGDAVLAVFGARRAREDDPRQAVRAALAMQEELARLNARMGARQGLNLAMRAGITTGPVLVTLEAAHGQGLLVVGEAVNLASRLQAAAPEGGILVTKDTYRHLGDAFEVKPPELLPLKGIPRPVEAYQVLRALPHRFRRGGRGVEGIETAMVGRASELAHLQETLQVVVDGQQLRLVSLVGEAGLGKTRLMDEFQSWMVQLPDAFNYFQGRARFETQNQPYALLRDLFTAHLDIQADDSPADVHQKLEMGLSTSIPSGRDAAQETPATRAQFIGRLLGFPSHDGLQDPTGLVDARQLRDRALAYLADFFQSTSDRSACVVMLEDLHWADGSSLDLIDQLDRSLADQPILIVAALRPSLYERRPGWGEDKPFHTRVYLSPLSPSMSRRLAADILTHVRDLPPDLLEKITRHSEGNPFYLEEIIKMMIEDGVIHKEAPHWWVDTSRLVELRVPDTLRGILQARLDSLPVEDRLTLQRASVCGRVFWDQALVYVQAAFKGPSSEQDVPLSLTRLQEKEMIFPRAVSAVAGAREYIFKHSVLRDVTYESLLRATRRACHRHVGEWLARQGGERAEEFVGLIADHLEQAGEITLALDYLQKAGEQAASRFANEEAVRALSQALTLTPRDDEERRYHLLLAREAVYDVMANREGQAADLESLQSLVEALPRGDTLTGLRRAVVALRQTHLAGVTSDYATALRAARRSVRLARICQRVDLEAEALLEWGRALMSTGQYGASLARFDEALALARRENLRPMEANLVRAIGVLNYYMGDYLASQEHFLQALALYEELPEPDLRGQTASLNNLGNVLADQGDLAAARKVYEDAYRAYQAIGDREGEALVLGNLAAIHSEQGVYPRAQERFEESMRLAQLIGERQVEANALKNLGSLHMYLGEYERAEARYSSALDTYRSIHDQRGEAEALAYQGLLSHLLGNQGQAVDYGHQAAQQAREIGDPSVESAANTFLGHALMALGRLDEAEEAYQEAVQGRRDLGERTLLMEALAGLSNLRLARGERQEALETVEEILQHIETGTLEGTEEPFRVYLTCYQVLAACQDPRALTLLEKANDELQAWAGRIESPDRRRSFLEEVAAHRELTDAWRQAVGTR